MFPLHNSANHAFVITRGIHGKQHPSSKEAAKSFRGSDKAVSWSCVRLVKHTTSDVETCPICLDSFKCARITKCGHCFCLTCLIRHIQYSALQDRPKCPCCSASLHLVDVRPVDIISVSPPRTGEGVPHQTGDVKRSNKIPLAKKMRFVKLYRAKGCSSPFLPSPSHPRHASPFALPGQSDEDAKFSRFTYAEPDLLKAQLSTNLVELKNLPLEDDMFEICRGLAIGVVESDLLTMIREALPEKEIQERYMSPSAGVYQKHHPQLISRLETLTVLEGNEYTNKTSGRETTVPLSLPPIEEQSNKQTSMTSRHRSSSVGSESSKSMEVPYTRFRSASVGSASSSVPTGVDSGQQRRGQERSWTRGSLYLGTDENMFFQSEDGQLCFLCGFNMQCLKSEFSTSLSGDVPSIATEHAEKGSSSSHNQKQQQSPRRSEPLPDSVEGRVVEVEHITLTRHVRQRMRFLSHLPLGTPVSLVEIGLGGVLSNQTKKLFAKEFQKRCNARDRRSRSEKRADDQARRQEEQRIEDNRAQMPLINRTFRSEAIDITSDAFGPALRTSPPAPPSNSAATTTAAANNTAATDRPKPPEPTVASFSAIARKASRDQPQATPRQMFSNDDFPSLGSSSNFPAIGSPPSSSTLPSSKWSTNKGLNLAGSKKGKKAVW